jgi:hypothetical protein
MMMMMSKVYLSCKEIRELRVKGKVKEGMTDGRETRVNQGK